MTAAAPGSCFRPSSRHHLHSRHHLLLHLWRCLISGKRSSAPSWVARYPDGTRGISTDSPCRSRPTFASRTNRRCARSEAILSACRRYLLLGCRNCRRVSIFGSSSSRRNLPRRCRIRHVHLSPESDRTALGILDTVR